MTDRLTIARPDDWHLHLRDGPMLQAVLPHTARTFGRALVMPNLLPPVVTAADAADYRDRILAAKPTNSSFQPLMTLYLTETTELRDLHAAAEIGLVAAVKLYPAGATTNSASGVTDLAGVRRILEHMAKIDLPLCVHGEVTDPEVDIFDREAVFVDTVLAPLRRDLPDLRIVLEHVTSEEGLAFIREAGPRTAGTITAHHLAINRTAMFQGGLRPHAYCLPVAKRERHRRALVAAATSGEASFFLGTDSAPHTDGAKEAACGCAGCFTAPVALPLLAHIFEAEGALDRLEDFVARNGARWYGLAPNPGRVTLVRTPAAAPAKIETGAGPVTIFDPGFQIGWDLFDGADPAHARLGPDEARP